MADDNVEYIDGDTGLPISSSELGNYDLSGQQSDALDFDELEFIDGETGKPVPADQIDNYDLDTAQEYEPPSPSISSKPGWGETISTNIGTGAANVIGGMGSLIDMLPGFDFGIGKGFKELARPYQEGGENFNKQIPEDSWQRMAADLTQGVTQTIPAIAMGSASIPAYLTAQGVTTFGQRANQSERELAPVVGPEAAREMSMRVGATDSLTQMPWNAIGMAPAFNAATDPLKRMALAGGSNALFSIPSGLGSLYANYISGATPIPPTEDQIWDVVTRAPIEGGILGTLMAGTQIGKERAADYVANRAMQRDMADMRARIDAYNAENGIKLLPAPEPGKSQVLGLPSPDDPNVVYAGEPDPNIPHQELGDISNPPIPKYQTQEQPFDKYTGSNKVRLLKPGTALEEGVIDPAANVIDARKEYSEVPILGKQKPVKAGKIILEDYIGQQARDDFYQAQLRGEPVSKNLEVVPPSNLVESGSQAPDISMAEGGEYAFSPLVNDILATAKAVKEASPSGKLEAEALALLKTVPKVQAEVQQLELQLPEVAQVDPVAAQQMQQEIVTKQAGLEEAKVRSQQLQQELNPAPLNNDPVVAKQKMEELSTVDEIDNSSNVFPEGIQKPNSPKAERGARPVMPKDKDTVNAPSEPQQQLSIKTLEESPSKKPSTAKSRLKSERGAVRFDFPNPFTTEGFKDFISRLKGVGYEGNPEHYKFFTSKWKSPLASQITKADKFPLYRKTHESSVKHFEQENSIAYDHAESIRPFDLLSPKEHQRVSAFLYEANRRGAEFDASDANMKKLGFSDREIRGARAVRNTMDRALDMIRDEAIANLDSDGTLTPKARAAKLAEINGKIAVMKTSNYVPQGRYGKYGLTLYDKNGKIVYFEMSDSKGKLQNKLYKEQRTNPNINAETSIVRPVPKALKAEFIGAHPDIIDMLSDADVADSQIPQSSLLQHFEKRKNIEGYDPDLGRNIASYLASHSRYVATQRLKREFKQQNKDFEAFYKTLGERDKKLYSGLKGEIEKLQSYMLTPSDSWQKTRKFLANYYLPFNPKTLAVNLTSFASTWPNVARYMSGLDNLKLKPEWLMVKTIYDTVKYYGGKPVTTKNFDNPNSDVRASVELARKEGAIGGSRFIKDLLRDSNAPTPSGSASKFSRSISDQDALFFANGMVEDFTKTSSHILGWHLWDKAQPYYKKRGIPMPDRHTFAKRFANETQGNYTKAGIPNIGREGLGKLGATFRLWPHGFFTILKKSVFNNTITVKGREIPFPNIGAGARFVAVLGTLGGVGALPFAGTIIKGAKLAGFDPDKKIDETTEKVGRALEDIAPGMAEYLKSPQGQKFVRKGIQPFGVDIGGGFDTSFLPPPGKNADPVGLAARVGLGVITDIPDRLMKAKFFLEKENYGRAAESLAPRAFGFGDIMKAIRLNNEGLTDSHGHPMMNRPLTTDEIIKTALGFTPSAVSDAYDLRNAENRMLDEQDKGDIYERMAKAYKAGDNEKLSSLFIEVAEKGTMPKEAIQSMMDQIMRGDSFEYNQIKRLGKRNMGKIPGLNRKFLEE